MVRRAALAFVLVAPSASAQQSDIAAAYGGTIPPQCVSAYVDLANLARVSVSPAVSVPLLLLQIPNAIARGTMIVR